MMKKLTIGLFFVLGTLMPSAQDICYVDQPQVDTYLYTQDDFGQSFMPCGSGELFRIDVPVHNLQAGEFTALLTIYEGDGYSGEVLYTSNVTITDEWGGFLLHTFTESVLVQGGQLYTYRLDFNGHYGTMWANFSNIYEEGQNYWNSMAQATIDMGFLVHIIPTSDPCVSWRGEYSHDWNEPLNWSSAEVPDSTCCVLIPEGSPYYPILNEKGAASELIIESSGFFELSENGELDIYERLNLIGQADLLGKVIMKASDGEGEILGSPTFTFLRLEGMYTLIEPIFVLDVLDLEDGYLANYGAELHMLVSDGHHGHVYMPNANIAGPLSFDKERTGYDPEPVGIPFIGLKYEDISSVNDVTQLDVFQGTGSLEESQSMWTNDVSNPNTFDRSSAFLFNGADDHIRLSGQVLNEAISIPAHATATELYDLNAIGNPFPSEVFLEGVQKSSGVGAAMYRWNAETRQYCAQVDNACVHGMEPLLRPLDVVFFHIPPGEEVQMNYGDMVLRPEEIQAHHSATPLEDHHIRLKAESASGSDETLIRFREEASWSWDRALDAMKIASTDALMPGFGSISEDGKILSINTLPVELQGGQVFLYLEPGVEGQVQLSPLMIDGGSCFTRLDLEDRKTGYFHDLMMDGSYSAEVLLADDRDRFVLHFNREGSLFGQPVEGFAEASIPLPFNSQVYHDHLVINMTEAPLYDEKMNSVRVYSVNGALVLDQRVRSSETRHSFPLHVNSGIYYLEVRIDGVLYQDKVWVD
jgi:hypothetical protein